MPIEINILNIVGVPPYDIFVCDCLGNNCEQVGSGVVIPPAYQFAIPDSLSAETCFLLRVVDSVQCVFEDTIGQQEGGYTLWQRFPVIGGVTPTPSPTTGFVFPTPTPTPTKTVTPTPTPSLNATGDVIFVYIPNL